MRILLIIILTSMLLNCSEKEIKLSHEQLYSQALSAATDNNQIITTAEEIVNLTADVLTNAGIAKVNGRTSGVGRSCTPMVDPAYLVDRSHYDTLLYIGSITVNYANGDYCPDASYVRKGKVIDNFEYIVNYKNEIFLSRETISFQSFKKDSVKIDGTFTIHSNSGSPVSFETEKTVITYPDGKSLVWKGELSFSPDSTNGQIVRNTISGTIEGITKRFESFTANITTPIIYNYDCNDLKIPVPVSGSLNMVVGQQKTIVNYGDGLCDNVYQLTSDGSETQHPLY